jgi:hypothetical protein
MPAQFHAIGTFHLRSRKIFVIYGDVLSGVVRSGMTLALPFNGSLSLSGRVAAVEFVDLVPQRRAYVGLVMAYDDPEELDIWEAVSIADEVLEISDASAEPA